MKATLSDLDFSSPTLTMPTAIASLLPKAPSKAESSVRYRVLIIEDDPNVARLISVNLTKAGLDSFHAPDGELGLQAFTEREPHLVLLDLMLPHKNGFEVCAGIRRTSHVPVVMMTARPETTHQMRGFRLGADDYILKPFDPQLLVARVVAHLRRVYRYDEQGQMSFHEKDEAPTPSIVQRHQDLLANMPEGWAGCGACSYMGPLKQFARSFRRQDEDEHVLSCPNCNSEGWVRCAVV